MVWWVNRSGAQRLWKGGKSGERWGQLVPPWPVLGDAEMIHFILSGALRRAVRWKWVAANPMADADPAVHQAKSAARILNEAWKDPDWRTLVWLTMVTGLRRGELCAIRWRHVNVPSAVLSLEKSISQRGRQTWEKETKTHQQCRITPGPRDRMGSRSKHHYP